MIDFREACKKAENKLSEKGYLQGFLSIHESSNRWFFSGNLANSEAVYGNVPVAVDKRDGKCDFYPVFAPGNVYEFFNANKIEVPDEYKAN